MTNLQKVRRERNLTQSGLSELSGVSLRTIQHYEHGEFKHGGIVPMLKIAIALKCRLSDILEEDAAVLASKWESSLLGL